MRGFEHTIRGLQAELNKLNVEKEILGPLDKAKVVWNEDGMREHLGRLRSQASALQLLLHVLQVWVLSIRLISPQSKFISRGAVSEVKQHVKNLEAAVVRASITSTDDDLGKGKEQLDNHAIFMHDQEDLLDLTWSEKDSGDVSSSEDLQTPHLALLRESFAAEHDDTLETEIIQTTTTLSETSSKDSPVSLTPNERVYAEATSTLSSSEAHPPVSDAEPLVISAQLLEAAISGDYEKATELLDNGCDIETFDAENRRTALIFAALLGRPRTLKLLLDRGANTAAQDNLGRTALHVAASEGSCESSLEALFSTSLLSWVSSAPSEQGGEESWFAQDAVEPNIEWPPRAEAGGSFRTSLSLGWIDQRLTLTDQCAEHLLSSGASVEVYDDLGEVALHKAARNGKRELVKLLLPYYSDPLIFRNRVRQNPLHLAVRIDSIDIVELICNHIRVTNHLDDCHIKDKTKARSSERCTCPEAYPRLDDIDRRGFTAVHIALINNLPTCLSFMLRCSSSSANTPFPKITTERLIHAKGLFWRRPIHFALQFGTRLGDMYKILVNGGANVNFPDANGHTPLWYANRYKNAEATAFLLSHGAKPSPKAGKLKRRWGVSRGKFSKNSISIIRHCEPNIPDLRFTTSSGELDIWQLGKWQADEESVR
jgi:ankyrin repeat protein